MTITATSPSEAKAVSDLSTAPELPESELRVQQALDHFWDQVDRAAEVYHAGQMLPSLLGQLKVSAEDAQVDVGPSTSSNILSMVSIGDRSGAAENPTLALSNTALLLTAKSPLLIEFLETCQKRHFEVESRPEILEGKQYLAISVMHPKV